MVTTQTHPFVDAYGMSTQMLGAMLSDVDDTKARARTRGGQGSSIAFLTGHLLASRGTVLTTLGVDAPNTWNDTFGGNTGANDGADYPSIAELAHAWAEQGQTLATELAQLDDTRLAAPTEELFPGMGATVRAQLQILAWHEAYHLGQIGLLRVEQGLPCLQQLVHPDSMKA